MVKERKERKKKDSWMLRQYMRYRMRMKYLEQRLRW